MTIIFDIPTQITQGDDLVWSVWLDDVQRMYAASRLSGGLGEALHSSSDTLSCFIRGQSALDLTGTPDDDHWDFAITSSQSATLTPGKYKMQYVVFVGGKRKAIATSNLTVCPSFESLTELETRSPDEIELEEITKAIAKLAGGAVSEYRIGDRMMRYQDLKQLTDRQQYLRTRIAIAKGKIKPGGRNVGVRFSNYQ